MHGFSPHLTECASVCVLQDHYPKLHMTQESFSSPVTTAELVIPFTCTPSESSHEQSEVKKPNCLSSIPWGMMLFPLSESDFPVVMEDKGC